MTYSLEDHQWTVGIWGRTITNLRFADDIKGLVGKEEELASLVDRLNKTSGAAGVEISAEMTKLMINNKNSIRIDIGINGEKLDEFQVSGRSPYWSRFQAWINVQNCIDNSSTSETEDHLERQT